MQNTTAVNQDLVNKVASENITLNPEITNALVAEAQAITNSSTLNTVNNEHSVESEVATDNAKSQVLNETLPVGVVEATNTNIPATDVEVSAPPVTVTSTPVSESTATITDTITEKSDVLSQVNSQSHEQSTLDVAVPDNTSSNANNGGENIADINSQHNADISAKASTNVVAANDTPNNIASTATSSIAPTDTNASEINEFPVPDINPQSQVFSVNSANQAPAFSATHNSKTDDLNVLIQGLETLNNQVVTNNNPHLGEYKKVLTNIITPKTTESSIVPENEELHVNTTLTQLSDVRLNQDLQEKFKLISDVSQYINHIYAVLKGYQTEAEIGRAHV